jgi:hypothetical protein
MASRAVSALTGLRLARVAVTSTAATAPAADLASAIAAAHIVYAGEFHEQSGVLAWQRALLDAASASLSGSSPLHLVLEHATTSQQGLLDSFFTRKIDLAALQEGYAAAGEGFDIVRHYGPLLLHARDSCGVVRAHAGFPARADARKISGATSVAEARSKVDEAVWNELLSREAGDLMLSDLDALMGSAPGSATSLPGHFSYFAWLLTGMPDEGPELDPLSNYRRIFPAQIFKDACMASAVVQAAAEAGLLGAAGRPAAGSGSGSGAGGAGKVVVICGTGHADFGFGVPERVQALLAAEGARVLRYGDGEDGVSGSGSAPTIRTLLTTVRPAPTSKEEEDVMLCPRRFPTAFPVEDGDNNSVIPSEERYPADFACIFVPDPEPEGEGGGEGMGEGEVVNIGAGAGAGHA